VAALSTAQASPLQDTLHIHFNWKMSREWRSRIPYFQQGTTIEILEDIQPGQLQPALARKKKKEYKTNNNIVPFRTELFPCSVLSDITQHYTEL
jgi:hypothetical protein